MKDLDSWINFYLAGAGAAAALTGLFIVAVSVNVDAIIATQNLPKRAAGTLATLVLALMVCMAGLMRDQGLEWFGAEVAVFAAVAWIVKVRAGVGIARRPEHLSRSIVVSEIVSGQTQTLPFVVGGLLLLFGNEWGLVWTGFGVLTVFALSMISTWVLLIEIRR